jgi:hypothetical protein
VLQQDEHDGEVAIARTASMSAVKPRLHRRSTLAPRFSSSLTSSRTGATLESKKLIPNHLVRGMIRAFNEAGAAL